MGGSSSEASEETAVSQSWADTNPPDSPPLQRRKTFSHYTQVCTQVLSQNSRLACLCVGNGKRVCLFVALKKPEIVVEKTAYLREERAKTETGQRKANMLL